MREKAIFATYLCLVLFGVILAAVDLVAAQIDFVPGQLLADIDLEN
jgi:hypothetical protein